MKKKDFLPLTQQNEIETLSVQLQRAIDLKESVTAQLLSKRLLEVSRELFIKTPLQRFKDFILSIGVALLIAIGVRQMWFEPYVIPSGSMRPTLKESDLLVVSKIPHGLNVPLSPTHFYFDPHLVQRGSIVTFTTENMDLDSEIRYFGIIPAKKQLVKRLIGKPGDWLYFYGGKIYGVDRNGNEIREFLDSPSFQPLEHIPFIRFEGKVLSSRTETVFYQMNQPVAKMSSHGVSERSELWGMGHFAMARLLSLTEAETLHPELMTALKQESAHLYLELNHHPSLQPLRFVRDEYGRTRPSLSYETSLLPLTEEEVHSLARHMTTGRFDVYQGQVTRLGALPTPRSPSFPDVPDGTYEFQNGELSQIVFQGLLRQVPPHHPLYANHSMERIQALYNLGIEFDRFYEPTSVRAPFPSRYAYFRDGDLYLLGAPIVSRDSPRLQTFLQREEAQKKAHVSYLPFEDLGPPLLTNGAFDLEKIKTFGLRVPEKAYLVLGDNHAMSGDSRQFGFVPEENLRGKVSFIFWPFGSRWGGLSQPTAPWITLPHAIIFSIVGIVWLIHWQRQRVLRRRLREQRSESRSLLS